jgi:hypothetical protein
LDMFNRFLSRFAPIGRSQSQPFAVSGNECWDLSSARVICRRLIVLPGGGGLRARRWSREQSIGDCTQL